LIILDLSYHQPRIFCSGAHYDVGEKKRNKERKRERENKKISERIRIPETVKRKQRRVRGGRFTI
jgi:HSP20 family molecular chaperone IbpA